MRKYLKYFVFCLFVLVVTSAVVVYFKANNPEKNLGNSSVQGERGGTWYIFDSFNGFQTKYDPSKIAEGANSNGQNTTINDGDRISIREEGYDLFPSNGTYATTTGGIKSMHTFRKRDGENILTRSYSTKLEYFEEGNDTWEVLGSNYSDGYKFGFADYNINTDLRSYLYFGNSQQNFSRWDGVHSLLNGAVNIGDSFITVDDASYFTTTGTIVYCGATTTYSAIVGNTFTLSASTTANCADNRSVASAPVEYSGNPKGNIYMTADNRLWIAGVTTTPQAVYFSKYGDAITFTTTTLINDNTDTASGIFNLGEGGGGVTGMIQDENAIYLFKKSIIRRATLSDTTYTLSTLKPFDGRSQTVGSIGGLTTFTSGNEVFFITPDNQILKLARVEGVDYPQLKPISEIIKPTVDAANFESGSGIVFKNKAYFAGKSTSDSVSNDSVFVFNLETQTWDSPIVGWAVGDFAVYDDGNGEALYWGDTQLPNVYKVTEDSVDYIYSTAANWRSKQFTFGAPQVQKTLDNVYVEGYISPNTSLTISLLLDEDGFTQRYSTTVSGSSTQYIYDSEVFNLFGFHPFGYERFGSNDDESGRKKFRVYLNKDFTPLPFYNAQIEFASDGEGQSWEVTSYSLNVKPFTQSAKTSLFKSFR